jgi:predicted XRE-type DNA-binding protein
VRRPGEALIRAELAARIGLAIGDLRLTQTKAAGRLGISQADVSDVVRGKLKGYSAGRLMSFLNELGQDIEISVKSAAAGTRGRMRVVPTTRRRTSVDPARRRGSSGQR